MLGAFRLLDTAFQKDYLRNRKVMLSLRHRKIVVVDSSSNMEEKYTGMEAKVVCLLNPDLLEAPGFGEFLDPECCVWVKQDIFFKLSAQWPLWNWSISILQNCWNIWRLLVKALLSHRLHYIFEICKKKIYIYIYIVFYNLKLISGFKKKKAAVRIRLTAKCILSHARFRQSTKLKV